MKLLRWAPRILGLVYAGFLALFALDVFGEGHGFWETALALAMHLVPTGLVVLVVLLAWRWPLVGAVVFLGLALLYAAWTLGRFDWTAPLVVSGPALLAGGLFLADFFLRRRTGSDPSIRKPPPA